MTISIWTVAAGSPFEKLFGANLCWVLRIAALYRQIKQAIGSFFMAFYRVLCMRRPAMKSIRRRKIVNQLLWQERIITVFLFGFFIFGWILR